MAAKKPASTTATKKSAPATKQTAASKKSVPAPAKATPAKKSAPAAKTATPVAPTKKAAPAAKKAAPATEKAAPAAKKAAAPAAKPAAPAKQTSAAPLAPAASDGIPAPRGVSKDGIAYTKDFDVKFLKVQRDELLAERQRLTGQAMRLEDEAQHLIEEAEMGDVQFDDEGGEGDTMVVERERDLALSAQARETVAEIDAALTRIEAGTYGYSVISGRPIPRERLEALPWATELVEEKVGGIGRR
jgi:RNA polymerase-binding transcription factor DksA